MTKLCNILLRGILIVLMGCEQHSALPIPEKITLGVAQQPTSILIYVASQQKLFEKYGLDVELKPYPSGRRALDDGLFKNQVDIISSLETPIALATLFHPELRIFASTVTANNVNRICARRDANIEQPADLSGKKIATQAYSAMHYFLHLFLLEQGIVEAGVSETFMKIEELVPAIIEERVQAISVREPYISQCQQKLGDKSILFSVDGLYEQRDLLVTSATFSEQHPERIHALLNAMLDAESYAKTHPSETINIMAQELGITPDIAEAMWSQFLFRIELPQALLSSLEDEVRWGIDINAISGDMPDIIPLLLSKPLSAIAPERVTLIP